MHIQEVILQSRCLPEMRRFYHDELGLAIEEESHNALAFRAGTSRLVFWQAPGSEFTGAYHVALGVPLAAFLGALTWLRERNLVLPDRNGQEHFHSEKWDADMVYFRDPAGNVVEFIAHADRLPVASGSLFSGDRILQVTEVGITTASVSQAVQLLRQNLKVGIFRDTLAADFAALGDQTARLILAAPGRIWNPDSGVPAGIHPLSILFQAYSGSSLRIDSPPDPPVIYPAE